MKIMPDITMESFSEGSYLVGYEGGIVVDLSNNFNEGSISTLFTVSKIAGCPNLYATGFSTGEANPNGLYTPVDPVNQHVTWKGGGDTVPLFIYWKRKDDRRNQPGNWIISSKTDERHFIAYTDLAVMEKLGKESEVRPPSGTWKQWDGAKWVEHPEITITCRDKVDRSYPKLIQVGCCWDMWFNVMVGEGMCGRFRMCISFKTHTKC